MSSDASAARRPLAGLLLGCAALAGCTSADCATGTVTFDGRPVETGAIVFRALDGGTPPRGGLIASGTYSVECQPGRHRVEIRGTRPVDDARVPRTMPRLGDAPIREDYIPAAYNTESTLEIEVKADGPNTFDFDLKSP